MKKIIILLILFVTFTNVLIAQNNWSTATEYFRYEPAYKEVTKIINKWHDGKFVTNNAAFNKFLAKNTYSFVKDNNLYMLSYDKCKSCVDNYQGHDNGIEIRNLYLYRLDNNNKWNKISDIIRTDSIYYEYVKYNGKKKSLHKKNVYYPLRDGFGINKFKGYIQQYKDNNNNYIRIRLTTYHSWSLSGVDNNSAIGTEIIILKQNKNMFVVDYKYVEYRNTLLRQWNN